MTKDEALRLALEALENIYTGFETSPRAQYAAITAIKEYLTQPEHPEQMARLGWQYFECPACGSEGARAFPKPEQWTPEDMAYRPGGLAQEQDHFADDGKPMQPEQDPVAWMTQANNFVHPSEFTKAEAELFGWKPVYTSPPKRQPLTDAEIWQLVNNCSFNRDLHADKFARAIEQAHGIGDKT